MKHQLRRALYIAASAALATALLPLRAHAATSDSATVAVTATVQPKITITVNDKGSDTADFGNVDPSGTTVSGQVSAVDSSGTGAYYFLTSPYTVLVRSNKAWTGSISASNTGSAANMTISNGALKWAAAAWPGTPSFATGDGAQAVAASPASGQDPGGFVTGSAHSSGTFSSSYYFALRTLWSDGDAGKTFGSTITFTATQG